MSGGRGPATRMLGCLVLVAFVLGHELDFIVTYGADYQDGLTATGHGGLWSSTVAIVLVLAGVLALLAIRRLRQLSRLSAAVDAGRVEVAAGRPADLMGHVLQLWPVIFVATLCLFVAGENVEHLLDGQRAPGLGVLGDVEYSCVGLVFLAVSLAAAFVGGLYRWRLAVLGARIAAASARAWDRDRSVRRPLPPDGRRPASASSRRRSARAPPSFPPGRVRPLALVP